MRIAPRHRPRGIALIVVMLVIVVLSLLAAGFSYSMKVEMRLAQNVSSEADLLWAARSGLEHASALLASEFTLGRPVQFRSLKQVWAGGPGDSMEPTITPARSFRLGDIECGVHITDAESKININLASREILERALELLGYDTLESSTVIDSIEDWRDPNQASRLNGAEEDYYMNLPNPYHCKDGPIDHLSELLLVKGVTPEMYWGRGRHSEIQRTRTLFADQAGAVGGAMEGVPAGASLGLVDLFNTYGQGRVNPNTASKEVLSLIPMVDAAAAETIVSVRSGMDRMDGTDDDTPFENLMELPVPPQVANSAFILMSAVFEVETAVHAGGYSRTNVAIVACRDGRSAQVLNAYWR